MNSHPTLRHFAKTAMLLSLLLVAACDNPAYQPPHIFGDEVPDAVKNAPRVVPSPPPPPSSDTPRDWPLLGAIPPRPTDFTPQPVIDAAKNQMENDRDRAMQMQEDYQAAPPVMPTSP